MFSSSYFNDTLVDERGKRRRKARRTTRRTTRRARKTSRKGGVSGQRAKFRTAAKACLKSKDVVKKIGKKSYINFTDMGKCMKAALTK